jgi:hypothetical protein
MVLFRGKLHNLFHVGCTSGVGTVYRISPPVFCGVRVTRSLVLCVCFKVFLDNIKIKYAGNELTEILLNIGLL